MKWILILIKMCGIAGFNWSDYNLIKDLIENLRHRGPDDIGFYVDDQISLGHSRLSIIDLSDKGKQPIHNEDETIFIIFNGEIYNYKLLRKILEKEGHRFFSQTDTEVIIHAYERYGIDCLSKFNGQFAFCIYDKVKSELFIARDIFGIKPLYYFIMDDLLIFASEIKSILKYGIDPQINRNALNEYLNYRYSLGPNTLFKEIYKLNPSHYIKFNLKTKKLVIDRYCYFNNLTRPQSIPDNLSTLSIKLFQLLNESVKLRMIADVPICCFLSGGIDSSILTGLASYYNPEIHTYSVGFENSSELKYAKIISEYFNTNHHTIIIKNDDILKDMEKMIYHMEEPIGDAAFLPTLLISKEVSKKFKVVLAGEGADEIFGGYDKYKFFLYGKKFSTFFPKFKFKNEILERMSKFSKLSENKGYIDTITVFNENDMENLGVKREYITKYWKENMIDLYKKMQIFDINTVLPEDFFMKADKMSSAFGLEERVPYMDYWLVRFAINLPLKYKLHLWNEKYILKKTFSNFLPKVIIKRRKRGYNTPMDIWLKTILKSRFIELLKENNHKFYNKDYILKLFYNLLKSDNNYRKNFYLAQKCWTIYIFEEWYNIFF